MDNTNNQTEIDNTVVIKTLIILGGLLITILLEYETMSIVIGMLTYVEPSKTPMPYDTKITITILFTILLFLGGLWIMWSTNQDRIVQKNEITKEPEIINVKSKEETIDKIIEKIEDVSSKMKDIEENMKEIKSLNNTSNLALKDEV